jgi:hypothetical protein
MQISERIDQIRRSQAELQDELALLDKLPAGIEISTMFRLRGQWHINLLGNLQALLALLPPAHATMTLRDGTWAATPENAPVNWNQRVLPLLETTSGVSWYHYLSDTECIAVKVEHAELPVVPGYARLHSHHSNVLGREVRQPATPAKSPDELDQEAWDAFYVAEGFTAHQLQFARQFHAAARYNRELSMDMLPIPAATTMEVAGESLAIRHSGAGPAETLPANSPLHALTRTGRFWDFFTKEQAARLVDFANAHRQDLQEANTQAVKAALERAKQSLANFEKEHLQNPIADAPDDEVLTHWVRSETGLPVSVSLRDTHSRRYGVYETWMSLWRFHESGKLTLPTTVYDPAGFSFQNPSFYEYEGNAGKF